MSQTWKSTLAALALVATAVSATAQTQVTAPKNKYSPADDVKLGQEAAQQVEQELPVMRDDQINGYLNAIGRRLAESIPSEFRHPEFRYSFTGVNLKEINAFALPGGPMFIQRGMIEKAHNEGEVAGVMAHELSHVALRHGTAQQTKATPYAIGQIAGQIAGAIIGGRTGSVIAQGSQFGIGTYFMKFSREYEKQADILGSRIMAAAGYDPRDMASVFKTIEQEGGPGGPQWMSDHPNPGNRYDYINKEAQMLRVAGDARRMTPEFQNAQTHLRSLSPAPSSAEVARNKNAGRTTPGNAPADSRPVTANVPRPASQYTQYTEGNLFRISVPSNWRELASNNSVTFAPDGAHGTVSGQSVFTHGVEIGVVRTDTNDLGAATDQLLQSLQQSNPRLSRPGRYVAGTLGGRQAARALLSNVSDVTGSEERIDVTTALLRDGSLLYVLGVAPAADFDAYSNVFRSVVRSIQLAK
jgi:peptidase M48-like protein